MGQSGCGGGGGGRRGCCFGLLGEKATCAGKEVGQVGAGVGEGLDGGEGVWVVGRERVLADGEGLLEKGDTAEVVEGDGEVVEGLRYVRVASGERCLANHERLLVHLLGLLVLP